MIYFFDGQEPKLRNYAYMENVHNVIIFNLILTGLMHFFFELIVELFSIRFLITFPVKLFKSDLTSYMIKRVKGG